MAEQSDVIGWDSVPAGGPESAPQELIDSSARELEAALESMPGVLEELRVILDRRVSPPISGDTWEPLRKSTIDLLGEQAAGVLLWTSVCDSRDEDRFRRLERLQASGVATALDLVRRVRASHGRELQEAWDLFAEPVNNWRTADRDVFLDLARGRAVVRIQLLKNNGERITLEGPADSYLNLAGFVTSALVTIGDRAAFNEGTISYYREATMSLLEVLDQTDSEDTPSDEAVDEDQAESLVN
jgi:hypothetical protein